MHARGLPATTGWCCPINEPIADAALPSATLARPPFVVDTDDEFIHALDELAKGHGPVAVDAERASGFTYSARAYLIQVSRRGGGTHLFDPIALADLTPLMDVIGDEEWIFHAATQDLACLAELGLVPTRIFDTELGSRLLGLPRVGLGTVVAELLGLHLAKEHSAANWSNRPLPDDWLQYAALDVEVLPDLRDAVYEGLVQAGKWPIAEQEFAHLTQWKPAGPKPEPWRRMSGLQSIRGQRNLAIARELWRARDEFARERDIAPGRVLPESSIIAAVTAEPTTVNQLASLRQFHGRFSRTELPRWWKAIQEGTTTKDLPALRGASTGLPNPRNWKDRHPEAFARFTSVREALLAEAEQRAIPVENLLTPDFVRKICWEPPVPADTLAVAAHLTESGARPWQVEATAWIISEAIATSGDKNPKIEE